MKLENLIEIALTLFEDLRSPTAKEIYAGAVAMVGAVVLVELILGMF